MSFHPSETEEPARSIGGPSSRSRTAGLALWTAILVLLVVLFATFKVLGHKQAALEAEGEATRHLRMSWQAMVDADTAVLDALVRRTTELARYDRAAEKLTRFRPESFPPTVNGNGRTIPSAPVIARLKSGWADMAAAIRAGDLEGARSLYLERGVGGAIELFVESAIAEIEAKEAAAAALQWEIRIVTALALGLVFVIVLFAYLAASRRGNLHRQRLQTAMHAANAAREAAHAATQTADASREQVTRLFQMTDMLQSAADHHDANAVLRATAADLIPGLGGALYVFNNSRDRLTLSTTWNREGREELPDAIGLRQCWSLKRGKPHYNVPNSHKLRCDHFTGPDTMLEIPMIARGEILGLLQIYAQGERGEERLAAVAELGTALADGMSLALANIGLRDRLRSQALRDPLTGLYNRRYMEDALQRVVGLAERERTEVSAIMIDLDHFKRLNDNYGHAKGDAVLRDSAAVLLNQLRETDIVCRYGGEELLVVLPNCALEMAVAKAERLRACIEALSEPNGAKISASMGVASFPSTSIDMKDLLATADTALYAAKQGGRNRVEAARRRLAATEMEPATLTLVAAE